MVLIVFCSYTDEGFLGLGDFEGTMLGIVGGGERSFTLQEEVDMDSPDTLANFIQAGLARYSSNESLPVALMPLQPPMETCLFIVLASRKSLAFLASHWTL